MQIMMVMEFNLHLHSVLYITSLLFRLFRNFSSNYSSRQVLWYIQVFSRFPLISGILQIINLITGRMLKTQTAHFDKKHKHDVKMNVTVLMELRSQPEDQGKSFLSTVLENQDSKGQKSVPRHNTGNRRLKLWMHLHHPSKVVGADLT